MEGLTLVFVSTKREADALEDFLVTRGFQAVTIHGDKSQGAREEVCGQTAAVDPVLQRYHACTGMDVAAPVGSSSSSSSRVKDHCQTSGDAFNVTGGW